MPTSSSLIYCAQHGLHRDLESLLYQGEDINQQDNEGRTPLMHAVFGDNIECVKILLDQKHKADTNITDNDGLTALHVACINAHEDCVKALLGADADTKLIDDLKMTPLSAALSQIVGVEDDDIEKYISIIKCIIEHEENKIINLVSEGVLYEYEDSFISLFLEGNLDEIKFLVEKCGIDVECKDRAIHPLVAAAMKGRLEVVRYLVGQCNVDPDQQVAECTFTAIGEAIYYEQVEVVEYLLGQGARIDIVGRSSLAPFSEACGTGNKEIIELLMRQDGDYGCIEYEYAMRYLLPHDLEIVRPVIEYANGIDSLESHDIISRIGYCSKINTLKYFIEECPITKGQFIGDTGSYEYLKCTIDLCQRHEVELVKWLIKNKGFNINNACFVDALKTASSEFLNFVLEMGFDPNIKDSTQKTLIEYLNENDPKVKLLLDFGSTIDRNGKKVTPTPKKETAKLHSPQAFFRGEVDTEEGGIIPSRLIFQVIGFVLKGCCIPTELITQTTEYFLSGYNSYTYTNGELASSRYCITEDMASIVQSSVLRRIMDFVPGVTKKCKRAAEDGDEQREAKKIKTSGEQKAEADTNNPVDVQEQDAHDDIQSPDKTQDTPTNSHNNHDKEGCNDDIENEHSCYSISNIGKKSYEEKISTYDDQDDDNDDNNVSIEDINEGMCWYEDPEIGAQAREFFYNHNKNIRNAYSKAKDFYKFYEVKVTMQSIREETPTNNELDLECTRDSRAMTTIDTSEYLDSEAEQSDIAGEMYQKPAVLEVY